MNLAAEGRPPVVYRPTVIFATEPQSGDSLRAAAAARRVTVGGWRSACQDRIFNHRLPESAAGSGQRDLVSYGRAAAMRGPGFASRVRGRRYAGQVRRAGRAAIGRRCERHADGEGERRDTRHE
jgi:hypothetical protein